VPARWPADFRYQSSSRLIQIRILYWQDIPSLIRVTAEDGAQLSRQLPDWFQQEIDRVAMEQDLIGSEAYLEQWEWREAQPREGSPSEVLDAVEAELANP
jgi:cvfA/B/C family virulence factor